MSTLNKYYLLVMKMTVMAKGLQFTSTAECKQKSKYKVPREKQSMKMGLEMGSETPLSTWLGGLVPLLCGLSHSQD